MEKIHIEELRKKSSQNLTKEDIIFLKKMGIINGCGGKGGCFLQKFFLKILSPMFFEASCDLHDFGYWKGGDEARRAECDRKFYEAILYDIYNRFEKDKFIFRANFLKIFWLKILEKYYKILAKIFYIAVRIGGKKYFTNFSSQLAGDDKNS